MHISSNVICLENRYWHLDLSLENIIIDDKINCFLIDFVHCLTSEIDRISFSILVQAFLKIGQ